MRALGPSTLLTAGPALLACTVLVSTAQSPRARLDEAQQLSAELKYAAAVSTFEAVKAQQPDAITSLDGLKMVTVYAETGNMAKFLDLTRWMTQRWHVPKTVTDAERQIKGYVVHRSAKDPELLAHAVSVTRYASEQAVAQDAGDYQGFFDTTRGIALYRTGRFGEAATYLSKALTHENLWVRSLAQPFYAMTLRAQGQRDRAGEMLAQARRTAAALPAVGTPEYRAQWTDTLITKMVMKEAEDVFAAATPAQALQLGMPGPKQPAGKAPEQGYVPEGWPPHTGSLLKYSVLIRFGEEPDTMPDGFKFGRVSAVTADAQGNVYAFQRGPKADPIIVFTSAGRYIRSWGKGLFGTPHGLRVDKAGNVWATDNGDHQVFKFANDGRLLQTWGKKGVAGTDATTFNRPTDLAWDSQGNTYVSDGYGNSRVVKFDNEGRFLMTWGTPGDGPGQFRVPHSIAIDSKDRVYVSDRENNRIQIFDASGKLLKMWTHLGCTQGMFITPADEMWVITHRNNSENITYDTLAGQLMKLDLETGRILGSLESPGHELTVAADGAIYVASLTGNIFKWVPDPRWPLRAGN